MITKDQFNPFVFYSMVAECILEILAQSILCKNISFYKKRNAFYKTLGNVIKKKMLLPSKISVN